MLALDGWGLSITSPDEAAAERYRALVDSYVRMRPDLADRLQEAVGGDTAPMARITRGYFMLLANSTAGARTAKGIVEGLAPTIPQLNEREQSHYDALVAWSRGDEKGRPRPHGPRSSIVGRSTCSPPGSNTSSCSTSTP